jgi:hypothetical protein
MRSRERSEMRREIEEREIERLRRSRERESQRSREGVGEKNKELMLNSLRNEQSHCQKTLYEMSK